MGHEPRKKQFGGRENGPRKNCLMGREQIAQKAFNVKGNGLPTKDLRGGGIDRAKSMWSTPDSNAKKRSLNNTKKSIHCINTQKKLTINTQKSAKSRLMKSKHKRHNRSNIENEQKVKTIKITHRKNTTKRNKNATTKNM